MKLKALGLCGIDESVDQLLLKLISNKYPFVEWGVLFRPDKMGSDRYPNMEWVSQLIQIKNDNMYLAAHLCGDYVNQVLEGDESFIKILESYQFKRIQVNATSINGVDTKNLSDKVPNLLKIIDLYPNINWIIQRNEETSPIWKYIETKLSVISTNISFLYDDSCGKGISKKISINFNSKVPFGYAGGINPNNIGKKLVELDDFTKDEEIIWIDMESGIRSNINGRDVFDINKAFKCILKAENYILK